MKRKTVDNKTQKVTVFLKNEKNQFVKGLFNASSFSEETSDSNMRGPVTHECFAAHFKPSWRATDPIMG